MSNLLAQEVACLPESVLQPWPYAEPPFQPLPWTVVPQAAASPAEHVADDLPAFVSVDLAEFRHVKYAIERGGWWAVDGRRSGVVGPYTSAHTAAIARDAMVVGAASTSADPAVHAKAAAALHLPHVAHRPLPSAVAGHARVLQVAPAAPSACAVCESDADVEWCEGCGCRVCFGTQGGGHLLACAGCGHRYHTACLHPAPIHMKPGAWHCPACHVAGKPHPVTYSVPQPEVALDGRLVAVCGKAVPLSLTHLRILRNQATPLNSDSAQLSYDVRQQLWLWGDGAGGVPLPGQSAGVTSMTPLQVARVSVSVDRLLASLAGACAAAGLPLASMAVGQEVPVLSGTLLAQAGLPVTREAATLAQAVNPALDWFPSAAEMRMALPIVAARCALFNVTLVQGCVPCVALPKELPEPVFIAHGPLGELNASPMPTSTTPVRVDMQPSLVLDMPAGSRAAVPTASSQYTPPMDLDGGEDFATKFRLKPTLQQLGVLPSSRRGSQSSPSKSATTAGQKRSAGAPASRSSMHIKKPKPSPSLARAARLARLGVPEQLLSTPTLARRASIDESTSDRGAHAGTRSSIRQTFGVRIAPLAALVASSGSSTGRRSRNAPPSPTSSIASAVPPLLGSSTPGFPSTPGPAAHTSGLWPHLTSVSTYIEEAAQEAADDVLGSDDDAAPEPHSRRGVSRPDAAELDDAILLAVAHASHAAPELPRSLPNAAARLEAAAKLSKVVRQLYSSATPSALRAEGGVDEAFAKRAGQLTGADKRGRKLHCPRSDTLPAALDRLAAAAPLARDAGALDAGKEAGSRRPAPAHSAEAGVRGVAAALNDSIGTHYTFAAVMRVLQQVLDCTPLCRSGSELPLLVPPPLARPDRALTSLHAPAAWRSHGAAFFHAVTKAAKLASKHSAPEGHALAWSYRSAAVAGRLPARSAAIAAASVAAAESEQSLPSDGEESYLPSDVDSDDVRSSPVAASAHGAGSSSAAAPAAATPASAIQFAPELAPLYGASALPAGSGVWLSEASAPAADLLPNAWQHDDALVVALDAALQLYERAAVQEDQACPQALHLLHSCSAALKAAAAYDAAALQTTGGALDAICGTAPLTYGMGGLPSAGAGGLADAVAHLDDSRVLLSRVLAGQVAAGKAYAMAGHAPEPGRPAVYEASAASAGADVPTFVRERPSASQDRALYPFTEASTLWRWHASRLAQEPDAAAARAELVAAASAERAAASAAEARASQVAAAAKTPRGRKRKRRASLFEAELDSSRSATTSLHMAAAAAAGVGLGTKTSQQAQPLSHWGAALHTPSLPSSAQQPGEPPLPAASWAFFPHSSALQPRGMGPVGGLPVSEWPSAARAPHELQRAVGSVAAACAKARAKAQRRLHAAQVLGWAGWCADEIVPEPVEVHQGVSVEGSPALTRASSSEDAAGARLDASPLPSPIAADADGPLPSNSSTDTGFSPDAHWSGAGLAPGQFAAAVDAMCAVAQAHAAAGKPRASVGQTDVLAAASTLCEQHVLSTHSVSALRQAFAVPLPAVQLSALEAAVARVYAASAPALA